MGTPTASANRPKVSGNAFGSPGLGWRNVPARLVERELVSGELVRIDPAGFDGIGSRIVPEAALSRARSLEPAAIWTIDRLTHVGRCGAGDAD